MGRVLQLNAKLVDLTTKLIDPTTKVFDLATANVKNVNFYTIYQISLPIYLLTHNFKAYLQNASPSTQSKFCKKAFQFSNPLAIFQIATGSIRFLSDIFVFNLEYNVSLHFFSCFVGWSKPNNTYQKCGH